MKHTVGRYQASQGIRLMVRIAFVGWKFAVSETRGLFVGSIISFNTCLPKSLMNVTSNAHPIVLCMEARFCAGKSDSAITLMLNWKAVVRTRIIQGFVSCHVIHLIYLPDHIFIVQGKPGDGFTPSRGARRQYLC